MSHETIARTRCARRAWCAALLGAAALPVHAMKPVVERAVDAGALPVLRGVVDRVTPSGTLVIHGVEYLYRAGDAPLNGTARGGAPKLKPGMQVEYRVAQDGDRPRIVAISEIAP